MRELHREYYAADVLSFGVASASLVIALFLPDRYHLNPPQFIYGIYRAFFVLGGMTILSTIFFHKLRKKERR